MTLVRPRLTVAVVMVRHGKLLFVEEHGAGGAVLNQPAGHVEPGESPMAAAVREAREETAWDVKPVSIVGLYRWGAPDGTEYLRVAYEAQALRHDPTRALDPDIAATHWLAPSELGGRALRSPLVQATVDDWLAGRRLPLDALRDFTA